MSIPQRLRSRAGSNSVGGGFQLKPAEKLSVRSAARVVHKCPRRLSVRHHGMPGYETGTSARVRGGHARPLRELKNLSISSENVSARAREWTRFPYSVRLGAALWVRRQLPWADARPFRWPNRCLMREQTCSDDAPGVRH